VAEHKKPVAIAHGAALDARFQSFQELPEDRFEAFLSVPVLCRDNLVGVINVQHRERHAHSPHEIRLISTVGFLVGPEIELARIEARRSTSFELSEARLLVETAKGILRHNLRIDDAEAAHILQTESRERHKSMKDVAEAILLADEIARAHAHGSPP